MTTLDKLLVRAQASGYSTTPPQDGVIRVALNGGAGRYRADIEGGTSLVQVAFILDPAQWQYFWAFLRNRAADGSEPFLADLVLDGSPVTEFTVYLIPGSAKVTGVKGVIKYVSAQLEVLPLDVDEDADSSVVDIFEAAGGDPSGYLDGFAEIIAALPEAP
ncbi:MAG TPA: hypothetical protein VHZ78_08540 [Rhizomicrobium sp.]|jgi:hypothetical protein|nr:hypothetical protein [Rhizomicrobium sp.]